MNLTGLNLSSAFVRDTSHHFSLERLAFVSIFFLLFLVVALLNGLLFLQYRKRTIKLLDVFLLVIYSQITNLSSILSLILILFEATSQYSDFVRGLSFPFLINCFCLNQIIILRLTRLDIKPIQFNGIKCVVLSTISMTLITTVLQFLSCFVTRDVDLIILSDLSFVCYAAYHIVCFILSAPKLIKYTRELRNVKREISIHTLSKRNYSSRESSMKRVKAPRLRNCGNLVRLVSDSESSECLTEQTKSSMMDYYICKHVSPYRLVSKSSPCKFAKDDCRHGRLKRKSDSNLFYEPSDEILTSKLPRDFDGLVCRRKGHRSMSFPREGSDLEPKTLRIPRSCCNLNKYDTLTVCDQVDFKHTVSPASSISSSITRIGKRNLGSGYVADSEVLSANSEFSEKSQSYDIQSPFSSTLPNSLSFLSFYRVQQGRLLYRLLYICYAMTFILGVSSIVKICRVYSFWGQTADDDFLEQLTIRSLDR